MRTIWKKILSLSLIYHIYNMSLMLYEYICDLDTVNEALKGDAFHKLLKKYLGMDAKTDWIGRLYGVVNPNLDEEGNFDFSNVIIELDGENTNTDSYINNWFYKKMILISELFPVQRLFDKISVDIKHVGPTDHDNYLIIFDSVSRIAFTKELKRVIKQILLYGIIILGVLWLI